jgi:pyrroline-5-carboxylate reductase
MKLFIVGATGWSCQARDLPEPVASAAVEPVICGSVGFLAGKMGELDMLLTTCRACQGVTAAGLDVGESGLQKAVVEALAAATAQAKALGQ